MASANSVTAPQTNSARELVHGPKRFELEFPNQDGDDAQHTQQYERESDSEREDSRDEETFTEDPPEAWP